MKWKEWHSVNKKLPDCTCGAYFISGHEWFGIGIWENGKQWVRGFIGEFPYGDDGDFFDNDSTFLNESVFLERNL